MAFFDFNPFSRAKKKQDAKKQTSQSKAGKLAENKARKAAALKRAAEKRKNPRTDLPGSSTGPKKKTQAERDKALRTNRQKAKDKATTPAKAPAKPKAKAPAKAPVKKATGTAPKFGVGNNKTRFAKRGAETKELANVTADQLKATGLTLRDYMNEWNKTGKRPAKKSKPPMTAPAKKRMSNFEEGRKKAMSRKRTVSGGYSAPQRKKS